jgi:hypothetical protein
VSWLWWNEGCGFFFFCFNFPRNLNGNMCIKIQFLFSVHTHVLLVRSMLQDKLSAICRPLATNLVLIRVRSVKLAALWNNIIVSCRVITQNIGYVGVEWPPFLWSVLFRCFTVGRGMCECYNTYWHCKRRKADAVKCVWFYFVTEYRILRCVRTQLWRKQWACWVARGTENVTAGVCF